MASRRKAAELISQKKVRVGQEIISEPGYRINPDTDSVFLDGKPVKQPDHFRYVLLNKPKDVLTTVRDDRSRKTVVDLIPLPERLFPVGRLDWDTEGVLLLTNDGDLAYRLTHPKYKVEKVRIRMTMPGYLGTGGGECAPKGKWLIGNVCPEK